MSAVERGPPGDRPIDPAAVDPLAAMQSVDTTLVVFGPSRWIMTAPLITDTVTLLASGDWTRESRRERRASSLACSSWAAASSTTAWEGAVAVATGPAGPMAEGLGCSAENAEIAIEAGPDRPARPRHAGRARRRRPGGREPDVPCRADGLLRRQ